MPRVTDQHKHDLIHQGYCVLRNAIAKDLISEARRAINHSLSQGVLPDKLAEYRHLSWCPELCRSEVVNNLINCSSMPAITQELLGPDTPTRSEWGQIALRFPQPDLQADAVAHGAHLDGTGNGTNGIAKGSFVREFSALAVCLLSEVAEPGYGNFTVWPGSHRYACAWFRDRGRTAAEEHKAQLNIYDSGIEPVQVTGKPGDVILAHHLTFHTGGGNYSDSIRYACIFRLRHRDCEKIGEQALVDPWLEWPGIPQSMKW